MPIIEINYLAVIIAVVATFFLGFIWYGKLFGKPWALEMGYDINEKPAAGAMAKGMILNIIGSFFIAYVLAHDIAAWNPVTWGLEPSGASPATMAGMAAFFTWLGFFLPVDLNAVAWEKRSWKFFGINTSYHFLTLLIAAMIIVHM